MKIVTSYEEIGKCFQILFAGIRKSRNNIYAYDVEIKAGDEGITLRNPITNMTGAIQGDVVEPGAVVVYYFLFRDILKSFKKGSLFIYTCASELVFHSESAKLSVKSEDIISSDQLSYCYYVSIFIPAS